MTHAQEAVTLRKGRPLPELLREMRVEQAMTLADIAYELRVTPITVAKWLRQYSIGLPAGPTAESVAS